MNYNKHYGNKVTGQVDKVPGVEEQKRNNAGGISFKISKWAHFERLLVIGTEGGTYYVSERALTVEACKSAQKCIKSDGKRAVDLIVSVSKEGLSASNDAAIFCLAMAASTEDLETRKYALQHLNAVCRIGTHILTFVSFIKNMRGFGRNLREQIANWYTSKNTDVLAYQLLKYQNRSGWTHADVLRMCHAQPKNEDQNRLFGYVTGGIRKIPKVSPYAEGARKIRKCKSFKAPGIIKKYALTREVVPTELLRNRDVWEALLENMPYTALVRNLGKMASLGMHDSFSDSLNKTLEALSNRESILHSRIHPLSLFNAILVYNRGRGIKGSLSWSVNAKVLQILDTAFYLSFKNVKSTGKKILLSLDVSGSMACNLVSGSPLLDCRMASAALAMVTMRVEEHTGIIGFTTHGAPRNVKHLSANGCVGELCLTSGMTLHQTLQIISNLPFSGTDCALPMLYAKERNWDVDAIVIYTDNETAHGNIHPWQALDIYQNKVGHSVKLVVCSMTASRFSIARPDYDNMLDVVGFSPNTPAAISQYISE